MFRTKLFHYRFENKDKISVLKVNKYQSGNQRVALVTSHQEDNDTNQLHYYEGKCGISKCIPNWLQSFNNPKMFLFSLSCFLCLQGAIATGFISVALSSIERRYNLTSALSAMAAASYEVGVILFILFTSYLGGRSHKPRVLGISSLVMGIGSLIFASPHYFVGTYNFNKTSIEMCTTGNSTDERSCAVPLLYFYPLFIIGNMIIGCGASTLYTVGLGFIDDSTHPRYSPIYLSIGNIVAVIGPCVGFGMGGVFLSLFVNPFTPTTLTSSDPQWVGAWWMGFVLSGILSIFCSIQFFFYPRRLRRSREYDKLRKQQQPVQDQGVSFENDHNISIVIMIKEYPVYAYRILKNVTFLFATFGITSAGFVISGTITFLPKYFQIQYSVSSSFASYIIGVVSIPAASLGMVLGGMTLFLFKKLTVERLALCVFLLTVIEVLIPPLFLLGCSSNEIAGVSVDYQNTTARTDYIISSLNVSCFSSCGCKSNTYQPVCGEGVTYFSPCLTGCPHVMMMHDDTDGYYFYSNCSCLNSGVLARSGKCRDDCTVQIIISAVLFFFAVTLIFYNNIPFLKLTLRCVADKDRTVALGIQSFMLRVLGQLPGPIVIGFLFDFNCILWEETDCGGRGSCLEYNSLSLKYSIIGVILIGTSLSSVFFFLAWITWKCRKIQEN
ncbi:solute carrier organic anion transporter family member 4A1 [Oopsacas minuta]|uniref:Solute carrier organic anion transporter family member n=1 Tax=Oopsacas minuta TaxID=111878 RepID=A0AAV7K0C2_9METZ|nr:solute carrier organic anion transporter family member 4A1 [Oopsacas minuta]